jgi:hypothetical protein
MPQFNNRILLSLVTIYSHACVCKIFLILSKFHFLVNHNQNKPLVSYTHFRLWRVGKWEVKRKWRSPGVWRFVYMTGELFHFHNDKLQKLSVRLVGNHWLLPLMISMELGAYLIENKLWNWMLFRIWGSRSGDYEEFYLLRYNIL